MSKEFFFNDNISEDKIACDMPKTQPLKYEIWLRFIIDWDLYSTWLDNQTSLSKGFTSVIHLYQEIIQAWSVMTITLKWDETSLILWLWGFVRIEGWVIIYKTGSAMPPIKDLIALTIRNDVKFRDWSILLFRNGFGKSSSFWVTFVICVNAISTSIF